MSIITFPAQEQSEAKSAFLSPPHVLTAASGRRGTQDQGRALEALGHAVEYLIDTRMFDFGENNIRDEQEAVQILMRMSRTVFAECLEVVSTRRRMRRWVVERFRSRSCVSQEG